MTNKEHHYAITVEKTTELDVKVEVSPSQVIKY